MCRRINPKSHKYRTKSLPGASEKPWGTEWCWEIFPSISILEKQTNKQKQNINENKKKPLTRGITYWIFKNLNYKHLRKKQTGNSWWWFLDRPRQAQTSRTILHWTTKHWITITLRKWEKNLVLNTPNNKRHPRLTHKTNKNRRERTRKMLFEETKFLNRMSLKIYKWSLGI